MIRKLVATLLAALLFSPAAALADGSVATAQGALGPGSCAIATFTGAQSAVSVTITGTWAGTIQLQGIGGDGTSTNVLTSTTANGIISAPAGGLTGAKACFTTFTSGLPSVWVYASGGGGPVTASPPLTGANSSGTIGGANQALVAACNFTTSPATVTSGNVVPLTCDSTGGLILGTGTKTIGTVTANAGTGTFAANLAQVNGTTTPVANAGQQKQATCDPSTITQCIGVNASGQQTALAAQSGTWTVQPGNTANTTAWKVDGSAVTQPVSGTLTANPPLTGANSAGTAGAAAQATVADCNFTTSPATVTSGNVVPLTCDSTGGLILGTGTKTIGTANAAQSGTWTVQPGNTANTTAWKVDGSAVTQPVSGTVTANPPLTGGGAGVATAVNQGVAISGYNGTTLDAIRETAGALNTALTSGATNGVANSPTACNKSVTGTSSTSAEITIQALAASQSVRVCGYSFIWDPVSGVATQVIIQSSTSATCAATFTNLWTLGSNNVQTNASQTNYTMGSGMGTLFQTASGSSLCIIQSSTGSLSYNISYAQY